MVAVFPYPASYPDPGSILIVRSRFRLTMGMAIGEEGNRMLIAGVHAAVLVPRDSQGELDEAALARELGFLVDSGIRNLVFNGATGEYCLSAPWDVERCLQIAKATLPGEVSFLCGIGAAGLPETLMLGRMAIDSGSKALLLPMPHFFPYEQDDLAAFVRVVASELSAPILLYNLPNFTSELEIETIKRLILECENIIGIKDSGDSLAILRALTEARIGASRIIGNDALLSQALTEGVCDGVVSGVACVLPELIQALFTCSPSSTEFRAATAHVAEFISRIDVLPVPWGLKAIAEARGIFDATYLQATSARRAKQIDELRAWFHGWSWNLARQDQILQSTGAGRIDQSAGDLKSDRRTPQRSAEDVQKGVAGEIRVRSSPEPGDFQGTYPWAKET